MRKIKVLLASRPKMLSDVVRNMIGRQPDMEVVGEVLDPQSLLVTVRATPAEVIIVTTLEANDEAHICSQLLAEHPQLKIVTLSAKNEAAYLYESGSRKKRIEEPCEQTILDALREAVRFS